MDFEDKFERLAGFKPLKWQSRLYAEYFALGALPATVDIPTGLGKTAVMAIWYLALKAGANLPRRLVYVVDRRAVVDQATTVADEIKARSADEELRVSTLRGQHVDKREWLEDPTAPAIIVGTVDMIGSRLLFSGYGVSRKMRPYHAGMLGADTLVVLDESHLVPPFERLLEAIEAGVESSGTRDKANRGIVPPFKLLTLSATGRARKGTVFRLENEKGDLDDDVVKARLGAKKQLTIKSINGENLGKVLADQAWALSDQGKQAVRIIIYCNSRETAEKTKEAIKAKAKADKKNARPKIDIETELFVGARRVKERVDAAARLKSLGFLSGGDVTCDKPAFLIATSAGEVGVDLDADRMVCDLVSWERMVQRLGRVNRLGKGEAPVVTIAEEPVPTKKEKESLDKKKKMEYLKENEQKLVNVFEKRLEAWKCRQEPFRYLSDGENGIDVSPGALMMLKRRAEKDLEIRGKIEAATTPLSIYPALTRPLIDSWSMTSLEKHTGRPEVAPWLRGWVEDDAPQTTVVWRKFTPVRTEGGESTKKEVEDFFEAALPHLSEKLETESWRVVTWIVARAGKSRKARELRVDDIVAFALAPDGELRNSYRLRDLLECDGDSKLEEKLQKELAEATLVVDARLKGLKDGSLYDGANGEDIRTADDSLEWPVDIHFRIRTVTGNNALDSTACITYAFATRLSGEGEDIERFLVETETTEESRSASLRPQLLDEHHFCTEKQARRIAEAIDLPGDYAEALAIAARLHDEGKKAVRWQRAFNAQQDGIYAKTRGPLIQPRLSGYRHEFGSLPHAERDEAFNGLPPDLQELVLHLIAAHHGRARPVIGTEGCDDAPPSLLEARVRETALRFARLQKRWGPWGLAWWEALLRAADQEASRENGQRRGDNGGI